MSLTFEVWLAEQHEREDYIGDFARGLNIESFAEKAARRKHNEHATWVDLVIAMRQPEYVTSFNDAWQEFTVAKEEAEAAGDVIEVDEDEDEDEDAE